MKHSKLMASLALTFGCYLDWAYAEVIEFDDASIIIEINATDDDSGIQMFVDGEGWHWLSAYDPNWRKVLRIKGTGSVRDTGLTELFFESAEPGFDDLPLEDFLERFPEGEYRFFGMSVEGNWMIGEAELTHNLPAGPELLLPEEDSEVAASAVTVMWDPVTTQLGGEPLDGDIVGYQVIVEQEEPVLRVFNADVTAEVNSISVPPEFMLPGVDYKFEVVAIEESGNQTLSEREFSTIE
jgi:hypothetical protein